MSDKPKRKRNIGKGQPLPLDEEPVIDPFIRNEFGVIQPQTGKSSFTSSAPITTDTTNLDTANRPGSEEKPTSHKEPIDSGGTKTKPLANSPSRSIAPIHTESTNQATTDRHRSGELHQGTDEPATQSDTITSGNRVGDVPLPVAEAELLDGENQAVILVALAREAESRAACWERLRKEARSVGMPRGQGPGTAYEWATRETERLFPPAPIPAVEEPEPVGELPPAVEEPSAIDAGIPVSEPEPKTLPIGNKSESSEEVSGLGDLPESWGTLPANASLQQEIAWVSANRLRVRSGSGVDLSRALSPAPSYAALSWLETSILFPSKFADISVKATAGQEDERESVRREKLAIEEIRSLLAEMLEG